MGDRGRPTRHEGPQFRGTSPLAGLGSPPHLQIPGDVAGDRGALMTLWVYVDTSDGKAGFIDLSPHLQNPI